LCKQEVGLAVSTRTKNFIALSAYWNPKCRSAFKRHETDQDFQKDAEQTATTCTHKEASRDTRARGKSYYSDRLVLPRRLEELIRKLAKLSKSFRRRQFRE
jgi:hypothetical protein